MEDQRESPEQHQPKDQPSTSTSESEPKEEGERRRWKPREREEVGPERESGRERLKRHRREMGGGVGCNIVSIPDTWRKEESLVRDWMGVSLALERDLVPEGIVLARKALVGDSCKPLHEE